MKGSEENKGESGARNACKEEVELSVLTEFLELATL
jgi:hypothetical protein